MPGTATTYTPMSGNGSLAVNSQLIGTPMSGQFFPTAASAGFYTGNGQSPPTVPINYMGATRGASSMGSSSPAHPFIMVGLLIVGILGLRFIHWRK